MNKPTAKNSFPLAAWLVFAGQVLAAGEARADMADIICDVYGQVFNMGGALGVMALIGLGIAMMMGKASFSTGTMILVGIGIVAAIGTNVVVGSSTIMQDVTGSAFTGCGVASSSESAMGDIVCGLFGEMLDVAGAISVLGISALGILAIFGKVSLPNVAILGVGMGLVAGADGILNMISNGVFGGCVTTP